MGFNSPTGGTILIFLTCGGDNKDDSESAEELTLELEFHREVAQAMGLVAIDNNNVKVNIDVSFLFNNIYIAILNQL
ncbi:hypothetical protein PLAN_80001 [Planktothrix rubescens CCAP 1459/22]|uniref:Uncharacterized protein n=1 Tax=Planktothrix rubescens CCAP 1459/22 TaxID=329571 RepID=A0A6J7ZQJ6_PLARU|nr:hypothetical protein PLAN_80001 [Planktothrix rubescens NIVA-CYA 18]